jgi:ATP-dependent DNA helicase RecG
MLYFLPRSYDDRRLVSQIAKTLPGKRHNVIGRIQKIDVKYFGRRKVFEVLVNDGSDNLKARWFKGGEVLFRKAFIPGTRVILSGKIEGVPFERQMIHPDFEILDDRDDQLLNFNRIVPIYAATEGLPQRTIRRMMWIALRDYANLVTSPIPGEILHKRRLIDISEALKRVHFPSSDQKMDLYLGMQSDAHRRLVYDEFFFFQLGLALRKERTVLEKGFSFRTNGEKVQKFYRLLPFSLTSSQKRAVDEIENDLSSSRRMCRLLQGDVGCGKTVVATVAMVTACENGYQSAIMAPTEVLARQHHRNMAIWAEKIGLRVGLLVSSMKAAERKSVLKGIESGEIDLIVGTHALIQEGVGYRHLGLVVIDEQHRFGVLQRGMLRRKGEAPDVLVMTATPIPRTLSMALYGDIDLSIIDEGIPGRVPVRTKIFGESQRERVYGIIRDQVRDGKQVFIVYPLREASENPDLRDATRMTAILQKEIFPDHVVALVHGRMSGQKKDEVMVGFAEKRIQILVATTVVEIGMDIEHASLMVIEHAERFGLSQLHQLRGRVGRGKTASYCILMVQKSGSEEARKRLSVIEQTNDGFRIAEEDLAIRGPGELWGTKQSGLPDFRIANMVRDVQILADAKADAFALVEQDPGLAGKDHGSLRDILLKRWGAYLDLENRE